jgi:hypothetical protein
MGEERSVNFVDVFSPLGAKGLCIILSSNVPLFFVLWVHISKHVNRINSQNKTLLLVVIIQLLCDM